MLERLEITGFAVARSVVIDLGPGLSVFTGETGAGKSLVVDALAFVFGARRGREVIAAGADRAVVRATVSLASGRTIIERTVTPSGRTTARVNDAPASVEDLRALAAGFLDIHGQSEQLAILRPQVQLALLDEFGGLATPRAEVTANVRELRDVRRRLQSVEEDSRNRGRLEAQLRFEIEEIAAAGLRPGEDIQLRHELAVLSHSGRLIEEAETALAALDSAPLGEVVRAAAEIAQRDGQARSIEELANTLDATAADLGRALRQYRDAVDEDPARLAAVGERLDLIARLCRKYGESVDDVLRFAGEAAERLDALTGEGQSVDALRTRESSLLAALALRAATLSTARREAAARLVAAVMDELDGLGMCGAALAAGFTCEDDPAGPAVALPDYEVIAADSPPGPGGAPLPRAFNDSGVDRVEFLASFNPGEAPRPLATVASGGETSRFLLALTAALGRSGSTRLEVLDEVDEGVGGRTGDVVGRALRRMAERHQVLCVTHLPQVAGYGDRHYVVTKRAEGGRTWSEVAVVEGEARVAELAAMLGGTGAANIALARELLKR